jgi:hypothetical protein
MIIVLNVQQAHKILLMLQSARIVLLANTFYKQINLVFSVLNSVPNAPRKQISVQSVLCLLQITIRHAVLPVLLRNTMI